MSEMLFLRGRLWVNASGFVHQLAGFQEPSSKLSDETLACARMDLGAGTWACLKRSCNYHHSKNRISLALRP